MEYPYPKWRGKPVLFSKHASEGILSDNLSVEKVLETLERGVETDERRKKGVFEFVKGFKSQVLKVVVADCGEKWLVVTVILFRR